MGGCRKTRVTAQTAQLCAFPAQGVASDQCSRRRAIFHGTVADLRQGELLTAGHPSNYRPEILMNHIYFTALVDAAGLAAEFAAELALDDPAPRVHRVAPTGPFENDPNVTDKKFSGNPTRSYRNRAPLRVLGEVTDGARLTPEPLQAWRERLKALLSDERAEILN
ncbi:MAG: NAD(+)--rifampin ADP-ribosyltransferase [Mycobacteriales bacterium]